MTKGDSAANEVPGRRGTPGTKHMKGFDRIRPAESTLPHSSPVIDAREDDVQGKRALFSGAAQPPAAGSVALECGSCNQRSVISFIRLAKLWATGIYIPLPGTSQRAWLKCPACERHTWVTISRKA